MKYLLTIALPALLMSCNNNNSAGVTSVDSNTPVDTTTNADSTQWTNLFDGTTFNGWHTFGSDSVGKAWEISDGTIHLDSKAKDKYQTAGGGDIVTNDAFSNFDLKLQWKISEGGNSGILFYVQDDKPKYEETWHTGLEMQVLDTKKHPDGKIFKHHAGDLYDLIASSTPSEKPVGEWNDVEIKCVDGKLDLYLNGTNTVSTTMWDDNWKKLVAGSKFKEWSDFATFKEGHIALQDHGNDVWYRNIQIRKL